MLAGRASLSLSADLVELEVSGAREVHAEARVEALPARVAAHHEALGARVVVRAVCEQVPAEAPGTS